MVAQPLHELHELRARTLAACEPAAMVRRAVSLDGDVLVVAGRAPREPPLRVPLRGRVSVVAAGKGALGMARGLSDVLRGRIDAGVVVVPRGLGHTVAVGPLPVLEAGHPLPDAESMRAGTAVRAEAERLGPDDLLVVAVSGGASAMLAAPAGGLDLADEVAATDVLLRAGAGIDAINAVRSCLSTLKGGGLARASRAATLSLVMSDVVSGRPETVGGGPGLPVPGAAARARDVIAALDLDDALPPAVMARLRDLDDEPWPRSRPAPVAVTLAGPADLRAAAAAAARELGWESVVEEDPLVEGPVGELAARVLARAAELHRGPRCHVWVGEPAVRVAGGGSGGRCSHAAWLVARGLSGTGATFLACGSDGVDGSWGGAGAIVGPDTWDTALAAGADPAGALRTFDTGSLSAARGVDLPGSPTGVNLTDLFVLACP